MSITWNTGLAARAQRDAAQYNLKLKKKRRPRPKAASSKPQAPSLKLQALKKTQSNGIK